MRVRVGVRVRERRFNHSEQPEQVVLVFAVREGNHGRASALPRCLSAQFTEDTGLVVNLRRLP